MQDEIPSEDAIVQHIAAESIHVDGSIHRDQKLSDIGLTGIALWACVAQIEREIGSPILDKHVQSWVTVGDILDEVTQSSR